MRTARRWILLTSIALLGLVPGPARAQVGAGIDLAALSAEDGDFLRAYGSAGVASGSRGVPVAGGHDVDGDGLADYAFSAFLASPESRTEAGEIYLLFGDGAAAGTLDTGVIDERILIIQGGASYQHSGSEIWMQDVTGDGLGDLLIARQDYTVSGRVGAGALTILVGGAVLATIAASGAPLDLGNLPETVDATTLIGPAACTRLGMWVRSGDVTGDGLADIVVGADQEGAVHRGAAYLIRGGAHLATAGEVDLADFGTTPLAGNLARIAPAAVDGNHSHFGATVQIGDLDGNGRGEVLIGVTLNRSGGGAEPIGDTCDSNHGVSDLSRDGTLVIAWDDNFGAGPWEAGYGFVMDAAPGTTSRVDGNQAARNFGEEIIAGHDFDADGSADLFVGDIVGDQTGVRAASGSGYVFWGAAGLAGQSFDLENDPLPEGVGLTLIQGARAGDIASDTAAAGDFDGDGIDDLAVASPCADPFGRTSAGVWDVLQGATSRWPAYVDLLQPPPPDEVFIVRVLGAEGTGSSLTGDTLGYSAAAGFVDGDGRIDLISNEMRGDGVGGGLDDVGNLVILPGTLLVPEPRAHLLGWLALAALVLLRRNRDARVPLH